MEDWRPTKPQDVNLPFARDPDPSCEWLARCLPRWRAKHCPVELRSRSLSALQNPATVHTFKSRALWNINRNDCITLINNSGGKTQESRDHAQFTCFYALYSNNLEKKTWEIQVLPKSEFLNACFLTFLTAADLQGSFPNLYFICGLIKNLFMLSERISSYGWTPPTIYDFNSSVIFKHLKACLHNANNKRLGKNARVTRSCLVFFNAFILTNNLVKFVEEKVKVCYGLTTRLVNSAEVDLISMSGVPRRTIEDCFFSWEGRITNPAI